MAKREDYLSNEYTENDKRLIKIFQEEVMRLDMLYYRAINSNQKDKAQELLSKIKRVVKELKSSYDDWANVEIPKEYLKWATYINDSVNGEDWLKVVLEADEKEVRWMIKTLWPAHIEAVNALLNTSKNYVKSSLDWMERQAISMLGELQGEKVREELAKGTLLWESLTAMEERIKRYFQNNKISWFKDRAGRLWSMDRYVDMLTRTETAIANIQGTINRAIQLWHTKFKVVENSDCCSFCADENWKIVDIAKGTVDLPPFHPNCRWFIVVVNEIWEEMNMNSKNNDDEFIKAKTPEERTKKVLDMIENSTMDLDFEQGAMINKNWEIIRMGVWDKSSVNVPRYWIYENYTFTHNHPNSSCFSTADLEIWRDEVRMEEVRASSKIWTYVLRWERFIDKLLFVRKYEKYRNIIKNRKKADMWSFADDWQSWKWVEYIHYKDWTYLYKKDNPLEFDKIFDEHCWKYDREIMEKVADDTPGITFEFIRNDWIQKDTKLNNMYLEKINSLRKAKRKWWDYIEDWVDKIDINKYI